MTRGRGVNAKRARRLHAARVATVATLVVMACYVGAIVGLDLLVAHRLTMQADARLTKRLAAATKLTLRIPSTTLAPTDQDHDIDDAPTFIWAVATSGAATALGDNGLTLPRRTWTSGVTTVDVDGTPFRFHAVKTNSGWLVGGESLAQLNRVRGALMTPELLFGAALLLVVYGGSLLIGLRASAPLELVRRRQAEFTADASHELRTPLSVIEAEVDLALSRPRSSAEYQSVLHRIDDEGQRLRNIVNDLLWLARVDDGGTVAHSGDVTVVADVARSCAERFQLIAAARDVSLRVESNGERTLVQADPGWIDRLVGVLVDNACKYAGRGGHVEVGVRGVGSRVVLRVDDSGPGIPADQRPLVFDRFHRGTGEPDGNGLGLAIADSIVRASNGTWNVGESPSGGARMEVSWRRITIHRTSASSGASPDQIAGTGPNGIAGADVRWTTPIEHP